MYKVYKVTNIINKKVYIGCTKETLKCRWKRHLIRCNQEKHSTSLLRSINKYGSTNFTIELIQEYHSRDEMLSGEIYWISYFNSYKSNNGYNETPGGDGGPTNLGKTFANDHVLKLSQSQICKIRKKSRRFSENIEKEICDKYVEGSSTYFLGKEYLASRSLILTILNRNNVKLRKLSNYKGSNSSKFKFDKITELKICELYNTGKYTITALAKQFNCGKTTARSILLRNNYLKKIIYEKRS